MKEEEYEIESGNKYSTQKPSVFPNNQNYQMRPTNEVYETRNTELQKNSHFGGGYTKNEKQSIKSIKLDPKTKTAIQIISYDSRHKFNFNDEAEEVV